MALYSKINREKGEGVEKSPRRPQMATILCIAVRAWPMAGPTHDNFNFPLVFHFVLRKRGGGRGRNVNSGITITEWGSAIGDLGVILFTAIHKNLPPASGKKHFY